MAFWNSSYICAKIKVSEMLMVWEDSLVISSYGKTNVFSYSKYGK